MRKSSSSKASAFAASFSSSPKGSTSYCTVELDDEPVVEEQLRSRLYLPGTDRDPLASPYRVSLAEQQRDGSRIGGLEEIAQQS